MGCAKRQWQQGATSAFRKSTGISLQAHGLCIERKRMSQNQPQILGLSKQAKMWTSTLFLYCIHESGSHDNNKYKNQCLVYHLNICQRFFSIKFHEVLILPVLLASGLGFTNVSHPYFLSCLTRQIQRSEATRLLRSVGVRACGGNH